MRLPLAAAFLPLVLLARARAEEPPPAPMSHWRDVVRAYDKSARIQDSDSRKAARDGLSTIRSVRTDSGEVIRPDSTAALNRITRLQTPGELASKDDKSHAATLLFLSELSSAKAQTDPAEAARQILRRPEFREAASGKTERSPLERYLTKQLQKFSEWLSKLFGGMPKGDGRGLESFAVTMRLFLYFLGGVLAIVIAWQVFRVAREGGWIKSRRKPSLAVESDLIGEDIVDPLADASHAESSGDLRAAVRLVYIATLRQLRDGGWIALEANRTNWEYQRQLARTSRERAALLRPATTTFDRIWYGGREATGADLATMRECYGSLSEAAE